MKKILPFLLCLIFCFTAFLFNGCGTPIIDHQIDLSSENSRLGTVSGIGKYKTNDKVTITATVSPDAVEGTEFIAWIKNNVIISYDNPYEFTASKETEGKYIAVFSSQFLQVVQLANIAYEENINTETRIINVKKVKLYLDNKEYFQPVILNKEETSTIVEPQNVISFTYDIDPQFVFSGLNKFYGSIELTYGISETESITKTTYFTDKEIDLTTNSFSIDISKPLIITGDETAKGRVVFTFSQLTKPPETQEE